MTTLAESPDVITDARHLRDAAHRHVGITWGLNDDDADDVAQAAYLELLTECQGGYQTTSPTALIQTIAARRAKKLVERGRESPVAPHASVIVGVADPRGSLEERFEAQMDVVTAAEALAQLDEADRNAYKLQRAKVSWQKATKILGCSRTQYFDRARKAGVYVGEALIGHNRAFDKATRKLINAYVLELESLSAEERDRAKRLITESPHAAALARELRRGHGLLAGALAPLGAYEALEPGLLERMQAIPGKLRELLSYGLGRHPEAADAVGGPAGAGLQGTAAQIVAVCGGATAVACAAVVSPGGGLREIHENDKRPAIERSAEAKKPRAPVVVSPAPAVSPTPVNETVVAPTVEVAPTAPVEPAASGSQEQVAEPAPSEPVPVEEAPTSDFTYGTPTSSSGASGAEPAPSASTSGGGGGDSGGAPPGTGGNFDFGQ